METIDSAGWPGLAELLIVSMMSSDSSPSDCVLAVNSEGTREGKGKRWMCCIPCIGCGLDLPCITSELFAPRFVGQSVLAEEFRAVGARTAERSLALHGR